MKSKFLILLFVVFMIHEQSYLYSQSSAILIKSEWASPKGIALVYPEKLPENPEEKIKKKDLIEFYNSFIHLILESSEIPELTIVHRAGLKEKLLKRFPSPKIKTAEFKNVQDIWIRDFAPIASYNGYAIKANYYPLYFSTNEKKYAIQDDSIGLMLAGDVLKMNVSYVSIDNRKIVLDGGNFIHNGSGVGITTNRIIADNESFSIEEIQQAFKEKLGLTKLIIVPVEPGDETGHIDGMVRFINENTVAVADYPSEYKEGKTFMDSLANKLKNDFNVVRILNDSPKDLDSKEFPSAFGNYINYLRIGNTIFLPQYNIYTDKAAKDIYEKYFKVISVSKDVDKLSKLGGVLNCITWTYY